jgi:hypothetical protein
MTKRADESSSTATDPGMVKFTNCWLQALRASSSAGFHLLNIR